MRNWVLVSAAGAATIVIVATVVMLVLLGWLGFELRGGNHLGLSERLLAGFQALWPLFVVLVIVRTRGAVEINAIAAP